MCFDIIVISMFFCVFVFLNSAFFLCYTKTRTDCTLSNENLEAILLSGTKARVYSAVVFFMLSLWTPRNLGVCDMACFLWNVRGARATYVCFPGQGAFPWSAGRVAELGLDPIETADQGGRAKQKMLYRDIGSIVSMLFRCCWAESCPI